MSKKPLTLSIIIPAYNEESHLRACLDSIACQSVKPDEVIVIDNNSTDKTVKIARAYNFVKLIHESKQGLIPARNAGFRTAKSDLLGRIDADSVLQPHWVATAKSSFRDSSVDAITGPAKIIVDSHFPGIRSIFWTRVYFWHALSTFRFQVLWGPNMVIRRTCWQKAKKDLCDDDRLVHEDQDISIILRANGSAAHYVPGLMISTDGIRHAHLSKALEYEKRERATILRHLGSGMLQKARTDSISRIQARLLFVMLLPFGLLYLILTSIFLLEHKLRLRS